MIEDKLNQVESANSVFDDGTLALKEVSPRGRISVAMAANLSAPKEPSLFDGIPEEDRGGYLISGTSGLIRGNGKPIHLSNTEHKLLNALTFFITQYIEDDDIKAYMSILETGVVPKQKYINRYISVTDICKFINNNSSRERERKAVFKSLKSLSTTYQIQQFSSRDKSRKVMMSEPLLILGGKASAYELEGKKSFEDKIEVLFGPLFFHEVANKYSFITPRLFEVWGREKGTNLDIFPIILSDLNAKYRQYYIAAQNAKKSAENEFKEMRMHKGKGAEELKAHIARKQRAALTYESKVETIKSKVSTDYDSTRQYKAKFWKDIQLCNEALKTYGIIEDADIDRKANKVRYIFSLNFGDDTRKIQ